MYGIIWEDNSMTKLDYRQYLINKQKDISEEKMLESLWQQLHIDVL